MGNSTREKSIKPTEEKPSPFLGLSASLSKDLNKKFKDNPIVLSATTADSVTSVKRWVSTGCEMLDLAISNEKVGGYPCGRVSVLFGKEQSGKSLLAAHALANTQKMGGIAIYIDTEFAIHTPFFNAIGVNTTDPEKWQYIPTNSLEVILTSIESLIGMIREIDKDKLITIVVDSFIATHTEEEIKGDYGLKGYNTSKSILIANGLGRLVELIAKEDVCCIFTNQVRQKLNAQAFEDPWRFPGGQALPHYATLMIKLDSTSNLKANVHGMDRVVGRSTKAKVTKNRLGPPLLTVSFDIFYDRGIDNYGSWVEYMKIFKIGKTSSHISYTLNGVDYTAHGKAAFAKDVLSVYPEVRQAIWNEICDKFIISYNSSGEESYIDRDSVESESILEEDN